MADLSRWLRQRIARWSLADPQLPAKFYAFEADAPSYTIPPRGGESDDLARPLPVPPQRLWIGYGKTQAEYLASGERRSIAMRQLLRDSGFAIEPTHRFLDFGCASGTVLRWFRDLTGRGEAWGVDIAANPIVWCQAHLSPPFKFATTTTFPHLPFEDRYFDLVHAGSVFTHIADLADAWLLELRRITRLGGRLVITVHDNHYLDRLLEVGSDRPEIAALVRDYDRQTGVLSRGFSMFTLNRTPGHGARGEAQVFYDQDYLQRHWGAYLNVKAIVPEGLGGRQTVVILEK